MAIDDERIFLRTSASNHIPHGVAYVHALPMVQEKSVIDLCCGTGYGTRLLSEAAYKVVGYDYSKDAINYNNSRPLPNVVYELKDVEKLSKLEADVITCMQGLEHLDDPKKLIWKHLEKMWIVALPNDGDDSNEFHHHKITDEMIQSWFDGKARISYFDDNGNMSTSRPDYFTNYFVVYRP